MAGILIFNIGNSDVQVKEDFELQPGSLLRKGPIERKKARETGEKLLNRYMQLKNEKKNDMAFDLLLQKLEYPIFEKVIKDIDASDLISIFLIASDQKNDLNCQDTIFYAELIKEYFNIAKIQKGSKLGCNKDCIIRVITTDKNPADYDDMNEFYKEKLRHLPKIDANNLSKIYICISGGTQAMNTMLLINGVNIFNYKLEVLYVLPHMTRPLYLQVGKEILKNLIKERLAFTIKSYDFHAAAELLKEHQNLFEQAREFNKIYHATRYAHARVSFDFKTANDEIRQCITNSSGEDRIFFSDYQEQVQFEDNHDDLKYFLELYGNAKYHIDRGEYIDFLGRIFRMQEAAFYHLAQAKGVGIEYNGNSPRINQKWLSENPALERYLENYITRNGASLCYKDRELNRTILEAILGFYAQTDGTLQHIMNAIKKIDKLATLRNHTPLAHGYQGASKEIIEQQYGEPFEALYDNLKYIVKGICDFLSVDIEYKSFYEPFGDRLTKLVEQLN
jgi:DNA-binding protein Fis